jgi:glycosyltransferase involved in cell wall biosynthesis
VLHRVLSAVSPGKRRARPATPVRIVYLHQYFTTPAQAGATRSYEFARRWAAAGHDVHVVTSDRTATGTGWRVETVEGCTVHAFTVPYDNTMGARARIRAFVRFALAAAARARSLRPDVVYATSTPLTIALPALGATLGRPVRYVFEVRDLWPDVPVALGYLGNPVLRRAAYALEMLAYRRAAHVVALAPGMREDILDKGIAADKVDVVAQGCDTELFVGLDTAALRAREPWMAGRRLVLFAGTLGRANGLTYLADLASEVGRIAPDVCFVVVGNGAEAGTLRQRAADQGLTDASFRMLGPKTKHEVAQWLAVSECALALFTGPRVVWKDAVQNKFFDALAAGKPVANNFDGWQTQVAKEAGVGIELPAHDLPAAAQALVAMLDDAHWMAGVPARASALADGPFNRDRQAGTVLAILARHAI